MTRRPILFQLASLICVLLALSFPLQVMQNYQIPIADFTRAFGFLTPMNYLVILLMAVQAGLSWNGSRALMYLAPFGVILVAFNNHQVGRWGYDYSQAEATTASLIYAVLNLYLLSPQYYRVLKQPSLRWWLVSKRKAIEVPIRVSPSVGTRFHSFTVDISETGAFIESQSDQLDIGDEVDLSFSANSIKPLQIKAHVVRKGSNQRQKRQDCGYGVKFTSLEPGQRKVLDKFLSTH